MTTLSVKSARDPYWDSLKAVMIFLVVLGHLLKGNIAEGTVGQGVYNFIYLFHMPLFIFISGRFSQLRDRRRYLMGMARLLETYVVFQLLLFLLDHYVTGHCAVTVRWLLLTPRWTLWYLLALVAWRTMVFVIPGGWLRRRPLLWLCGSVVIAIAEGFIPRDIAFTRHHILSSLPFFLLGYYSVGFDVPRMLRRVPLAVAWFMLFAILAVFCLWIDRDIYSHVTCGYSYRYDASAGVMGSMAARVAIMLGATVVSAFVMRVVPARPDLASWGSVTLVVYVYHAILLTLLKWKVDFSALPCSLAVMLVVSIAVTGLLVYVARFGVVRWLVNPVTPWLFKSR